MCSSVGGSAPILTGCGRRLFQGRLVTAINTRELTVNEITCAVCFRVYRRDLEQAMRVRAEPDRDGQHAEDGHHRRGGSRGQSMGEWPMTCAHHWLIPAASGKREDVATCKLCGTTKTVPISWPRDWPEAGRERQKTKAPISLPRVASWVRAKEKGER